MIGTNYTNKLPASVRDAMKQISHDDCYLIKRRVKGVTGTGKVHNCHQNVQDLVDRIGGERVSGWLLMRQNQLFRNGIYVWIFHSIWKTPEDEYVDVTQSDIYGSDKLATFWHDSKRAADLDNGTAYNSIIAFENAQAAKHIADSTGVELAVGQPYWTTSNIRFFMGLHEHSGEYRLLTGDYPNNTKMLEEEYNCKVEGGRLIPKNENDDKVSTKIFFDYSLS
jgi:hypothetical protein